MGRFPRKEWRSLDEVRTSIAKYRRQPIKPTEDPVIGCILLGKPFFFEESEGIPSPPDFKGSIVSGNSYDMESGTGLALWQEAKVRLASAAATASMRIGSVPGAIESPSHIHALLGPATLAVLDAPRLRHPNSCRTTPGPRLIPRSGD